MDAKTDDKEKKVISVRTWAEVKELEKKGYRFAAASGFVESQELRLRMEKID